MKPKRKSREVGKYYQSSDSEEEEAPIRPRRKSKKVVKNICSGTTVKKPKRKSKEPDSSDSEHKETPLSGFAYEGAINNLSLSSPFKDKLLKLCKRVAKTFVLTEDQVEKVRAFKLEIEDSSNLHEFSFTRGIFRPDEGEEPFSTSAFTAEEVHTIEDNYSRFCKKFGFHPKEDLSVFLPGTFRQHRHKHLSHMQEQVFCSYLSENINRPPRSVYVKFVNMYYFYRKGPYTEEEDELLLSWYELNPGKHMFSVLGRILHRYRQLVRRRVIRLLRGKEPAEKSRNKFPFIEDIKMQENDKYPDWTMDEEAWREIADANGEYTVKQLKKSYFRDLYPSVKASSLVSSNTFIYVLITKMTSLKNPTWDNVDWKKLGQYCFRVGAVRVYSAIRMLTKDYVPREHWKDLAAALMTIKEKHHIFNGPKKFCSIGRLKKLLPPPSEEDDDVEKLDEKVELKPKKRIKESCPRSLTDSGSDSSSDPSNEDEKLDKTVEPKPRKRIKETCWRSMTGSGSDTSSVSSRNTENCNEKIKQKPKKLVKESCLKDVLEMDVDSASFDVWPDCNQLSTLGQQCRNTKFNCSAKCKDEDAESSDGGTSRKNTDSVDPLSTDGNPNFDAKSVDKEEEKFILEESEPKMSPKKKSVKLKRKKVHKKSDENLDSYRLTCKDQIVENSDGGDSRKNTDSGDPLSTDGNPNFDANALDMEEEKFKLEESDLKMSPKKKSVKSKRKKLRQKSEESSDSCSAMSKDPLSTDGDHSFDANALYGMVSECIDPDTKEEKFKFEESDSKLSPKKKSVKSKRKKICKKYEERLDSCSTMCKDISIENSDSVALRINTDSVDPLSTDGDPNFDANALDGMVSECIDPDPKEEKFKLEESDPKMSPKKKSVKSKRKKLRQKSEESSDSCSAMSKDPLLTDGDPNFDANALDGMVSECIDPDTKEEKFKLEESDPKLSPKKKSVKSKRKKLCKKYEERLDSCSTMCKDISIENSDSVALRINTDSVDPLSTDGGPNFDANALHGMVSECIDPDTKEEKFKLGESDSRMSPKKKSVELDQLIDAELGRGRRRRLCKEDNKNEDFVSRLRGKKRRKY